MEDDTLLGLAYRGRPDTVAALAAHAHVTVAEIDAAVDRLAARGLLVRDADRLALPHPAVWTTEAVAADLTELRRESEQTLARVEGLVASLPALLQQWAVGEAASDLVPVITRHGPQAAEDLWYDTARRDGGAAQAVFPTLDRFLDTTPERSSRFAHAFAGKESVRAILPSSVAGFPTLIEMAERYAEVGVQFRTLPDPPSWFWIDGDMLALPFEWGEGWPTSVLAVRGAALASVARSLFEELWRRAEPLTTESYPWTALLNLMRQGITLDAASRTSGINPRTGRRRIAAAMQHYGVSTLFALGVAWAADRDATG